MNNQSTARTPLLERFQNWAALLGAALFTFFVHPFVYGASVGFVREFGQAHYGAGAVVPFTWWLITFVAMVALMGVILKVAFTGGVISLIRRFA